MAQRGPRQDSQPAAADDRRPPGDRRLVALYAMIRRLNSESDPDALLRAALDMALDVVRAERGLILLREPAGDSTVRLARNLEQQTVADAEAFSRSIVARASEGQSVLAFDVGRDPRFRDLKSISLYGIQSVMCVPLRSRGEIVGAVYVDDRRAGAAFTRDDLRFLEAFADHAALALENARTRARLEHDNRSLRAAAEARVRFGNLVGESPPMRRVFELIEKSAESSLPVLIRGESGTGKELVARAIHFNGPRRRLPFVSENCAALPDSLLQSELFGHARGAFTGAERDRQGLFEQADGGTLFLDEIGDMSPTMQAQLLRVLEAGEVRRVGESRVRRLDVRLLAATHRDLQQRLTAGLFREDLFYRLQVLVIHLPPLRERRADIELLVRFFLGRIARERGRPVPELAGGVLRRLVRHDWPGNVRQLENVLQRVSLLAGDGPITDELLERDPSLSAAPPPASVTLEGDATPPSLAHSERRRIREALEAAAGNRARAARMLGISRATIYRKIKEYRL